MAATGMEVRQVGAWQIATVPNVAGDGFMAWAKMGMIVGTNPIDEPGQHVWFSCQQNREEAVGALLAELGLVAS